MNVKKDFPLFNTEQGNKLIYVDNAASSQKPQAVLDAIHSFYTTGYANIHRGIYKTGEFATTLYEQAREIVATFIGAQSDEIVFTKGTTESINFIAATWAYENIGEGDEIVVTEMEHHSNLLPWQRLAHEVGATLVYLPITDEGQLDYNLLPDVISSKTKLVAVTHVSNVLGTVNDVPRIVQAARSVGAKVLIDGAQAAPHMKLNMHELDPDFYVFSGHKMLGPTGIGVLYIKKDMQAEVPPYQLGGSMVSNVTYDNATWLKPPHCYEAGTPPIAQAIGLGAAINYLTTHNFDVLKKHEAHLCARLIDGLQKLSGVRIFGPVEQLKQEGHLVSFVVDGMHAHDVAAVLDQYGIAVRAGNHCAQLLTEKLGITASVRVSFYLYNTVEDVDHIVKVIKTIVA